MSRIRKIFKRLVLALGVLLLLLVGALFAIPYFFEDELVAAVKQTINDSIDAEVNFEKVNLSLLKRFPNVSLELENLSIIGKNEFEGIHLAKIEQLGLTIDAMSLFQTEDPVAIRRIDLGKPEVNILVTNAGHANYNISKSSSVDSSTTETGDFAVALQQYNISEGSLRYRDLATNLDLRIEGLQHTGTGDFTSTIFDLNTSTQLSSASLVYQGVPYLKEVAVNYDAILRADLDKNTYTFKDNTLQLNALQLQVEGIVELLDDDINLDLALTTPQNRFKDLLSLIPNAYTEDFADVDAGGHFRLQAAVAGTYSGEKELFPAIMAKMEIKDGTFKYPSLPMGVDAIQASIAVNSPNSDFDQLTVDIPIFQFELGDNPLKGNFFLKTPLSDPDIDTRVIGVLDFKALANAFPMDGMEMLEGILDADITAKTRMSFIESGNYDAVNIAGTAQLRDFVYRDKTYPTIRIKHLEGSFSPQFVDIPQSELLLGRSDVKLQARIDNILAWFSPEKTMTGTFNFYAGFFDANEWYSDSSSDESLPADGGEADVFDRFKFATKGQINTLVYSTYELNNLIIDGDVSPKQLNVSQLKAKIGDSDFALNGTLNNLFDYAFEDGLLTGSILFSSAYLDLNQFMVEESTEARAKTISNEEDYEPIEIPANIDLAVQTTIKRLKYANLNLNNVRGAVDIADQEARLDNVTSEALGGQIGINGGYNTQTPEKPAFDLKYSLQNIDFQEAFLTLNTMQALMPMAKYINGRFNTNMVMSGTLDDQLMPVLSELNAAGFLETLNAIIQNFKPLKAVDQKLGINQFDKMNINNTKNWFEIKNGRVELKPTKYQVEDIALQVGGAHGLDLGMEYGITAKIPRSYLDNNAAGQAANKGLEMLQKEAGAVGINLNQSEFINVRINLTGNLANPKVGVKFLGSDGKTTAQDQTKGAAEQVLGKAKDDATQKASDELEKAKTKTQLELERRANEAKSKAKTEAQKAIDKAKDEATKKVEEEIGNKVEEKAKEVVDEKLGDKGKEEADKIKEQLEDWNPFKKKKKDKDD